MTELATIGLFAVLAAWVACLSGRVRQLQRNSERQADLSRELASIVASLAEGEIDHSHRLAELEAEARLITLPRRERPRIERLITSDQHPTIQF